MGNCSGKDDPEQYEAVAASRVDRNDKSNLPEIVLEYFPVHGRGEQIRLIFAYTQRPNFTEKIVTGADFGKRKARGDFPNGSVPVVYYQGLILCES